MDPVWTGERLETFVFAETSFEHLHRYAFASRFVKDKTVLDVACGEGYGSNLLASTAKKVIGIDIDDETIPKASAKYQKANLEFKKGSATSLPLEDNQFDIVVSFETIEHIAEHDQMLAEIKRVLKPGGLFIISTPDKKSYSDETGYKNKYHVKELYAEEFRELICRYFKYQKTLQQSFVYASLIVENSTTTTMEGYSGDFAKINSGLPKALYRIIVASDETVDDMTSSIFYDEMFLQKALQNQLIALKKTFTYRLGHFLLRPFKWVASNFKS